MDTYESNYDYIKTEWDAKKQCELYTRDKKANIVTQLHMCMFLECEAPGNISGILEFKHANHQYEYENNNFFARPALDDTFFLAD